MASKITVSMLWIDGSESLVDGEVATDEALVVLLETMVCFEAAAATLPFCNASSGCTISTKGKVSFSGKVEAFPKLHTYLTGLRRYHGVKF